jgi:perosamine synthetase
MHIGIHNTYIHPHAIKNIRRVIDSTFLSEGKIVQEFEKKLEAFLNISNIVTVNSGTSALHLAAILSGISSGDEVILPAQTFIATGLVPLYQKAVPVFADIEYETGNISADSIRKKITKKSKAIIVVHWGGNPCNLDEIHAVADYYHLPVIEDAAHAIGAIYKGKPVGNLSDFTCFSFQAIKHLTTGDGGAICCRSQKMAEQAKSLRWFGIDRKKTSSSILGERQYNLESLGYKFHLNNYGAALGISNLDGLKKRLEQRRRIAAYYRKELQQVPGISLFKESPGNKSSYWIFGMHVEKRIDFIRSLKDKGIEASVVHQRIDRNKIFSKKADLPIQEVFDKTQVHIPIHDAIDKEKAAYIVQAIKKGW